MDKKLMKIHFIGIGGIGVSALAGYYLKKGNQVSGSDLTSSEITDNLIKMGASVSIGKHKISNLHPRLQETCFFSVSKQSLKSKFSNKNLPDLVIYSPAVEQKNPELKEARKLGIRCLSYPEALGELTKKCFTIAVSGTHGKSTTTAMISLILIKAGLNPTVILGTKLKEFNNNNFRIGKPVFRAISRLVSRGSEILVIEADEWNASFLNYWPKIIVLTNIEKEHLDYYKNLNNILQTFREYVLHLPENGILVTNGEDKNISNLKKQISKKQFKIRNYNLKQKEAKILKKILKTPGEHNIYNALAALSVAKLLKISDKISFKALSEYRGAWRRFELKKGKIDNKKFTIVSDYGHHPTEINATLKAAREKFLYQSKLYSPATNFEETWAGKEKIRRSCKKIWCIFQPHQYQRTFYLFKNFINVFKKSQIDKIIITDIYDVAGREDKKIKQMVSAEKLVKMINRNNTIYLPKEKIEKYLKKNLKGGEIVIVMGAGNIYNLTLDLIKNKK